MYQLQYVRYINAWSCLGKLHLTPEHRQLKLIYRGLWCNIDFYIETRSMRSRFLVQSAAYVQNCYSSHICMYIVYAYYRL